MHKRRDDGEDGLRASGGDGNLRVRIITKPIGRLHLLGEQRPQLGYTRHGRILIAVGEHLCVHEVRQPMVHRKTRKTLSQVEGAVLRGELRHDGEDGGAHVGQLAGAGRHLEDSRMIGL